MKKGKKQIIVYIKTEDIYIDIAKFLRQGLILQVVNQTEHYLKEKRKVIRLMKDKLGGKNNIKFVTLRSNTYRYLTKVDDENK